MYWSSLHCGQIWHKQNSARNIQFQVPDIYILYLAKRIKIPHSQLQQYCFVIQQFPSFHVVQYVVLHNSSALCLKKCTSPALLQIKLDHRESITKRNLGSYDMISDTTF